MYKVPPFAATLLCAVLLTACNNDSESGNASIEGNSLPESNRVAAASSSRKAADQDAVTRADNPELTADYAKWRRQQIANVDYKISVILDAESESFSGTVVADTRLTGDLQQPLTIDFSGGTVEQVKVGEDEVPFEYNGYFISIAPDHLAKGDNRITIFYRHPYSTDGSGLHRFQDPEDGSVYLYTHFEPYKANRFFPHFDQPDLKAHYRVDVKAPADWQVVTTVREDSIEELDDDYRHWHFPQTKKFSSYILPLHAGPYRVWEDDADGIPLRLMARQTLAANVKPEDWFTFTKQSFEFFQDYFAIEYPFGKYDQVIVPDFTIGAMENVAAVTFNEAYVSRGEKTQAERQRLANVIAHEMAHMWFGDLVTMDWWNGLWLKESFATYMAYLALAENSDFDDVWENFYLRSKQSAYDADGLMTTHPIELPVANTAEAFSNFDGITYGKGGSVLKQLPYYLGREEFRQGVRNYLHDYAYGNATLQDFMQSLGEAADRNLEQWTRDWLYQPGVNTIRARFSCKNDQIRRLTLHQSAPDDYPVLREQRIQLGLYRMQRDTMSRVETLPVTYSGAETEVEAAKGLPCPQILNPNEEDWGYVKVQLDSRTVEQLSQHINDIESAFTRLMLWQNLYDSVLAGRMSLSEWIRFARENAGAEQDINVIRAIASHLESASEYLYRIDLPQDMRLERLGVIEDFIWQQLSDAPSGSDEQKTWFDSFTTVAHTGEALDRVIQLLGSQLTIEGLTIDQDRRWQLVILLNRHLYGDYRQLLEKEQARDSTDRGHNSAITAAAIRPRAESKQEWLDNILRRDQYKLSQVKAATAALFPAEQLDLFDRFSGRVFSAVPNVNAQADTLYSKAFAMVFPIVCGVEGVEQYRNALDKNSGLMPTLEKALKNQRQRSRRCLRIKP
ncbi:aminopeptidase N [Microbulbifer yueqingensis]|uniref:Aminopeptidase N n=1 Tax=Microbulbifer yueqingensis TaxID=658219 RepID=A0A1G9DNT3_9GAMM|nr:aminopeptidase N [Microbulbifer yueqingensis]SDK65541.1 Membrane alanyl aminopeptidase Metallo peptidase. MEROPS family M01 [Microbulbifer yueqingensis]